MAEDKKLFLLDAFALIYRAHFAFIRAPRINSKGMNTSAVFGFTNVLLDLFKKEKPTHIGIVYDTHKPTFRHEEYAEYKAGRQEQPEDIQIAIPYVQKISEAFGIPNLWVDGYEADDVIGTLAKKALAQGYTVYMMTPDKDFGQLVEPGIFQFKPAYGHNPAEILGVEGIKQKWDIDDPIKVIDILGLMGDSIDNIPGLPGVGEKTAIKLVKEYGSVENLIANAAKLTGKLKQTVEENADKAILSKRLATIDINAPIEFDEKALTLDGQNDSELKELFAELEFKNISKRIFGEEDTYAPAPVKGMGDLFGTPAVPAKSKERQEEKLEVVVEAELTQLKTIENVEHDYTLLETEEEVIKLAELLHSQKEFCFDTETSGVDVIDCFAVGLSASFKPGQAWYIAIPKEGEAAKELLSPLKEVFKSEYITKIGQNVKFDLAVIEKYGLKIKGPVFDTMLAHYLIEPDQRHGMDALSQKYLNYDPVHIDVLIGKRGKKQMSMADIEPIKIRDYACEDADITLQLKTALEPLLIENNAQKLFQEVEVPLIAVLADMEKEGVRIDKQALNAYSLQLGDEMGGIEKDIYELAGMKFNINSPSQLGEVLFDKLKLDDKAKRTSKSKQYATGEEILTLLAAKHDIAQKILDYRQLQKLKSTYIDTLPLLINKHTGRVHTSYNQAVAATGRLSSTDPNLQNIPIRTERGREIRKAFIPRDENHTILSADYSQIELRLIAAISGDANMLEAFKLKTDIHTATSARVFNVPLAEVTSDMRRKAKMVNFGIIYGISAFGLSQRLRIPRSEAAEIIAQYNKQYPGINEYLHKMIEFAREHGYVETLLGRRRYLRDINSGNATVRGFAERNAINAPIQGSAADMIKVAMIHIHNEFEKRKLRSKMILQVHDELVFDALKTELEEVKSIVHEKMVHALKVDVPIEVEMGAGDNWLEAH